MRLRRSGKNGSEVNLMTSRKIDLPRYTILSQNYINDDRTTKEKFRVVLRRYGDCFIIHCIVLLICFIQLCVYIHAFQRHHSSLTHSIFSMTFAGLNVFLFGHFAVDIIILFLLHFVIAPTYEGPPNFQQVLHTTTSVANERYDNSNSHGSTRRKTANALSRTIRSLPVGPFFDIVWSCISIVSGVRVWKTHPLFFFRLMGYAIHHSRLPTSLRMLIGVNKRLFDNGEFLLDMTYITDRVIAMGLPAQGVETLYRNPLEVLATYMRMYHPSRHMVINTCAERIYNKAYFHKLCLFPCKDHEVMPLNRILVFCQIAYQFLSAEQDTVIVVHCMGGKGRTGLMVTSWLLYSQFCNTAEEAMRLYGKRRTDDIMPGKAKTLSNPCQIRFLRYFEETCKNFTSDGFPYLPAKRSLKPQRFIIYAEPLDGTCTEVPSILEGTIIRLTGLFPPPEACQKPQGSSQGNVWDYLDIQDSYNSNPSPELEPLIPPPVASTLSMDDRILLQDLDSPFSSRDVGNLIYSSYSNEMIYLDWSVGGIENDPDEMNNNHLGRLLTMPASEVVKLVCPVMDVEDIQKNDDAMQPLTGHQSTPSSSDIQSPTISDGSTVTPIIRGEFGIELTVQKESTCGKSHKDRQSSDSIGRIWLHSNYLHVDLPRHEILQDIWSLGKKTKALKSNQGVTEVTRNDEDHDYSLSKLRKYQEIVDSDKQRRVIVAYKWDDVDFETKKIRDMYKKSNFLLICVFDDLGE